MSWTDGTPTGSDADDQYYYWCNTTANSGWTFTVPAGTTAHTLYILWGGAASAAIKLNAHLSDGSASDYTDTIACGGSITTQLETITYHAASASQTLTFTLTTTASGGSSVDLDAAWLQ